MSALSLSVAFPKTTTPKKSELPETYHEAWKMRMRGVSMTDVAKHFGVDRVTIWRRIEKLKAEAAEILANEMPLNAICESLAVFQDLEDGARRDLEAAKSGSEKVAHRAEARKNRQSLVKLCFDASLWPKAPDKLFAVVAENRPYDSDEKSKNQPRDRKELIETLIDALSKGRTL